MTTTEDTVIKLLSKLPGECAWIDYKVQVYSKEKMSDAIKDSIAMLNSNEAFGKDKYLIFGVAEVEPHKYHPVGIKSSFPDDAHFQNLFDKIVPRPTIETSVVEINKLSFGYFFISKENNDRVYEVALDYGNGATAIVKQGQSFIRVGSTTRHISPQEREDILAYKLSKGLGPPNKSLLALQAIDTIEQHKYTCREDNGTITFQSDNNNGRYNLGHSDRLFTVVFM